MLLFSVEDSWLTNRTFCSDIIFHDNMRGGRRPSTQLPLEMSN